MVHHERLDEDDNDNMFQEDDHSQDEINWNNFKEYLLSQIKDFVDNGGTEALASTFLSIITSLIINKGSTAEHSDIDFQNSDEPISLQLLFEDLHKIFCDSFPRIVTFSQLLVPYVQDLYDAYPTWIDNHTTTNDERYKHEKIIEMLKRLKENLINVGNSYSQNTGAIYFVFTVFEVVEKIFQAGEFPSAELLSTTLDKYPELNQFIEDIMLKIIEFVE